MDFVRENIDKLDPLERQVINALFYERVGRRTLGHRLHVSPRQVARIRDRAILKLGHLLGIEQDARDTDG